MPDESSEARRRGLMEKIVLLFMHEGLSHQTMEGIAGNIGISKRTLYKYFPNKDLLIDTVVRYKLESIEAQVLELLASEKPFLDRLVGFFVIIEKALKPMQSTLLTDIVRNAPWIWTRIDEFRHSRILVHLEAILREGHERGHLRSDIDVSVVSPIYMAIIEQVGRPEVVSKLNIPPSRLMEAVLDVMLGGVLSEQGRRAFEERRKEESRHD